MRLITIAVCSIIFARAASAQPGVCNVVIVRAPDSVREVVEGWVRAEPRCTGTLEVRILPTDGGYYLFARDLDGRTRERVVPDPQSAGVLIASWAADDAPPVTPPAVVELPVVEAAPTQPFVDRVPRTSSRGYGWGGGLTLAYLGSGTSNGVRAEADVAWRGPVTAGLSFSHVEFVIPFGFNGTDAYGLPANVSGHDTRMTVYGTDTLRQGPLSIRFGLGVGAKHTISDVTEDFMAVHASKWYPIGELSLEVGVEAGRWSLIAGAVGTVSKEAWNIDPVYTYSPTGLPMAGDTGPVTRYTEALMMFGARCRL